jgi:hypothetical protein
VTCRRCYRRRPYIAQIYQDEFCSRECAEETYGTKLKNQASVKDVEGLLSRAAYRGPQTPEKRKTSNAKYWAKRRRAS